MRILAIVESRAPNDAWMSKKEDVLLPSFFPIVYVFNLPGKRGVFILIRL
jgi:hypothetical protein